MIPFYFPVKYNAMYYISNNVNVFYYDSIWWLYLMKITYLNGNISLQLFFPSSMASLMVGIIFDLDLGDTTLDR